MMYIKLPNQSANGNKKFITKKNGTFTSNIYNLSRDNICGLNLKTDCISGYKVEVRGGYNPDIFTWTLTVFLRYLHNMPCVVYKELGTEDQLPDELYEVIKVIGGFD